MTWICTMMKIRHQYRAEADGASMVKMYFSMGLQPKTETEMFSLYVYQSAGKIWSYFQKRPLLVNLIMDVDDSMKNLPDSTARGCQTLSSSGDTGKTEVSTHILSTTTPVLISGACYTLKVFLGNTSGTRNWLAAECVFLMNFLNMISDKAKGSNQTTGH